jgi:hypothetical protein
MIKFKTVRDETVIVIPKNVLYFTVRKCDGDRYDLAVSFVDGSITKFTVDEKEFDRIKAQIDERKLLMEGAK